MYSYSNLETYLSGLHTTVQCRARKTSAKSLSLILLSFYFERSFKIKAIQVNAMLQVIICKSVVLY